METAVGVVSNALIQFVYVWLVREYFEIFLEKREKISRRAEIAVWIGYYVLDWGISYFINYVSERIIYTLLSWLLLGLILYRDKLRSLLLVVASRYCISIVSEFIVGLLFSLCIESVRAGQASPWAFTQILMLFTIKVGKLLYQKKQKEKVSTLDWFITVLIPCGSIYIVCILLWYTLQDINSKGIILSSGANIVLVIMVIGVFFVYEKLGENAEKEKVNAVYKRELLAYHQQNEEREMAWNEMRRFRHDYKNKLLCLEEYVKQEDMAGLVSYIEGMRDEESESGRYWKNKCGNVVIDALLNSKIGRASREGIDIETDIRVPQKLPYEEVDLSVILGNALDNAIEAAAVTARKKITLKIEFKQKNLFIRVRNPYQGEIKRNHKGEILTNKEQKKEHGIGLLSIRKAVEKYHGLMEIGTEEQVFELKILLYSESI